MGKQEKSARVMIDLRWWCSDFNETHLSPSFKKFIVGYYLCLGLLVAIAVYAIANIAIARQAIDATKAEEIYSISQIRELQTIQEKTLVQIKETNQLIDWLFPDIHGQRLVHVLFSNLSKEVILEKFSFKRDRKNKYQVAFSINLKGVYRALHNEFEIMLSKLEALGFVIVSQNQSEINGGMRLQCTCQMNMPKNNNK